MRAIVFRDNHVLLMKRNKFGKLYYTLPGGGIDMGETSEVALAREMQEETGLQLGDARLVFVEDAGEPYGVQYMYLVDYIGGEPRLSAQSVEAEISALGKNTYEPVWVPMSEVEGLPMVSERLKHSLLTALKSGFPKEAQTI